MFETMMQPKLGSRTLVYENEHQRIYELVADFGSFRKQYFVNDFGPRVGIVVVKADSIVLVRQYRLLINGFSWEIPGGKVDDGETPALAAVRECLEESGVQCGRVRPLVNFYPGLDTLDNRNHIFYTDDVQDYLGTGIGHNPDEISEHGWYARDHCLDMIFQGQIVDSLSIVGLLTYHIARSIGALP
jgi:8-oxo-dGTP pyrophosphatase MutT (NUDIX family)